MLEGLYRVDWENLTHAYGSAADVPGMILALASPEKEERAYGFQLLRENLCHQGAIYEASGYIVTYLNQLLEHPLFEEKPQLLILLAHLARGKGPLALMKNDGLIEVNESDPEIRLRLAMERKWARQTHDAIRAGRMLYLRCLDHADSTERIAAAYLLMHLPDTDGLIHERLSRRMEVELKTDVKSGLLFALGKSAARDDSLLPVLAMYTGPAFKPLMRLASLMSLTHVLGEATPAEVRIGLIDLLSTLDRSLPQAYAALPFAEGHMFADIALCLCRIGPAAADEIVPDLIRVLDRVDTNSAVTIAYAMLYLGLSDFRQGTGVSESQRAILEATEASIKLWDNPRVATRLLQLFDLPGTRRGIRALLSRRN